MSDTSIIPGMRPAGDAPERPGKPSSAPVEAAPMTLAYQARMALMAALKGALRRFHGLRKNPGGFVHGLLHAAPPSVAAQIAYAESKAWVPPGHDGQRSDRAGQWYHRWIGIPAVALFAALGGIASRPFYAGVALGAYGLSTAFVTGVLAGGLGVSLLLAIVTAPALVFMFGAGLLFALAVVLARPDERS